MEEILQKGAVFEGEARGYLRCILREEGEVTLPGGSMAQPKDGP